MPTLSLTPGYDRPLLRCKNLIRFLLRHGPKELNELRSFVESQGFQPPVVTLALTQLENDGVIRQS